MDTIFSFGSLVSLWTMHSPDVPPPTPPSPDVPPEVPTDPPPPEQPPIQEPPQTPGKIIAARQHQPTLAQA